MKVYILFILFFILNVSCSKKDESYDDILKITVKNANGKERTIAVSTVGQGELYAD